MRRCTRIETLLGYYSLRVKNAAKQFLKQKRRDRQTLLSLYESINSLTFYSHKKRDTLMLWSLFVKLRNSDKTPERINQLEKALRSSRLYKKLKKLKARYPHVVTEEISNVLITKNFVFLEKAILTVTELHNTFALKNVAFSKEPRVLIVGAPDCHFFRKAVKEITSSSINSLLNTSNVLVVEAAHALEYTTLKGWEKNNPRFKVHPIYDGTKWGSIDLYSTPKFYFMKGNKTVSYFSGWKDNSYLNKFKNGLDSIGLKSFSK